MKKFWTVSLYIIFFCWLYLLSFKLHICQTILSCPIKSLWLCSVFLLVTFSVSIWIFFIAMSSEVLIYFFHQCIISYFAYPVIYMCVYMCVFFFFTRVCIRGISNFMFWFNSLISWGWFVSIFTSLLSCFIISALISGHILMLF